MGPARRRGDPREARVSADDGHLFLADPEDIPDLAALSRATFGPDGLGEASFRRYLSRVHALVLGLRRGPELMAYSLAEFNRGQRRVYIVETCTRPDQRGRGLALRLRHHLEQLARDLAYGSIASHVRASNLPARHLNLRAGMRCIGIIPAYYDDGEDGHYFRCQLIPRAVRPAQTRRLLERRPSATHGDGLVARHAIAAGVRVITCCGRLVVAADVDDSRYAMQVGQRLWLVSDPGQPSLDDFINHSCDANLGFIDGSVTLRALRPIQAGEELTWDYSTSIREPAWAIPCRCGAPSCRHQITGFDALPPTTQARLRPQALTYLR